MIMASFGSQAPRLPRKRQNLLAPTPFALVLSALRSSWYSNPSSDKAPIKVIFLALGTRLKTAGLPYIVEEIKISIKETRASVESRTHRRGHTQTFAQSVGQSLSCQQRLFFVPDSKVACFSIRLGLFQDAGMLVTCFHDISIS